MLGDSILAVNVLIFWRECWKTKMLEILARCKWPRMPRTLCELDLKMVHLPKLEKADVDVE